MHIDLKLIDSLCNAAEVSRWMLLGWMGFMNDQQVIQLFMLASFSALYTYIKVFSSRLTGAAKLLFFLDMLKDNRDNNFSTFKDLLNVVYSPFFVYRNILLYSRLKGLRSAYK